MNAAKGLQGLLSGACLLLSVIAGGTFILMGVVR